MHSRAHIALAAAIGLAIAAPAAAQSRQNEARIAYVPINNHPPVPAGLQVVCTTGPFTGGMSKTCPVVKYQGITTWAYSYADNRPALALVSYDGRNNVVRNVTKWGARYVFVMTSSVPNKTVVMAGQNEQTVTADWSELGTP